MRGCGGGCLGLLGGFLAILGLLWLLILMVTLEWGR